MKYIYCGKNLYALKKITALSFFLLGLIAANAQDIKTLRANFGVTYPLSTNGVHAPLDTNNLSIHLLVGVSSVEKGSSFAGLSNVVRNEAVGAQFAGFSNHIGRESKGGLFAGFANTYRSAQGSQFAGFANLAQGKVKGAQFTGFLNTASDVDGVQFAGFSNIAKDISASQFAGFINIAKDVKGSQFAGFINIAKKVTGTQVAGFINIAESSDCPIGIINIIKKGEKSVGATLDESQTSMLTFRSGGRSLYGIIGAGYNFKNKDEVYAFEAGFGAHFFSSRYFRLNLELTQSMLENFEDGEYFKSTLRLLPALKITKTLEFFVGPSMSFVTTNTVEGLALHSKDDKNVIHTWQNRSSDFRQSLLIGYQGGVQFIF
jgi:hypothetical protein